jgi:transposase
MKAYSMDLRERIIGALESGRYSQAAVGERYEVSLSFVEKLWHRHRTERAIAPKAYTPGPKRVLAPHGAWIRAALAEQPDITLAELCEQLEAERQVRVHPSMMWRELERLRLPLKKSRSTIVNGTRRA